MTTGAAGSSGPLTVRLPASARDGGLVEMVECEGAVEQVPVLVGAGPRIELGQALDAEGGLVGLVADVVTCPVPREVGEHCLDLDSVVEDDLVPGPTSKAPVALQVSAIVTSRSERGAHGRWQMPCCAGRFELQWAYQVSWPPFDVLPLRFVPVKRAVR